VVIVSSLFIWRLVGDSAVTLPDEPGSALRGRCELVQR
jgi:hypothetical protein